MSINGSKYRTMCGFFAIAVGIFLVQLTALAEPSSAVSNNGDESINSTEAAVTNTDNRLSDDSLIIETVSVGEKNVYRPGETAAVTVSTNQALSDATYTYKLYRNNVLYNTTELKSNQFSLTFDEEGTYAVKARVSDALGSKSEFKRSESVDVIAEYPQTPEIYDFRMESGTDIQRGESAKYSYKVRGGQTNMVLLQSIDRA